jgi:hypothetical protein
VATSRTTGTSHETQQQDQYSPRPPWTRRGLQGHGGRRQRWKTASRRPGRATVTGRRPRDGAVAPVAHRAPTVLAIVPHTRWVANSIETAQNTERQQVEPEPERDMPEDLESGRLARQPEHGRRCSQRAKPERLKAGTSRSGHMSITTPTSRAETAGASTTPLRRGTQQQRPGVVENILRQNQRHQNSNRSLAVRPDVPSTR